MRALLAPKTAVGSPRMLAQHQRFLHQHVDKLVRSSPRPPLAPPPKARHRMQCTRLSLE